MSGLSPLAMKQLGQSLRGKGLTMEAWYCDSAASLIEALLATLPSEQRGYCRYIADEMERLDAAERSFAHVRDVLGES